MDTPPNPEDSGLIEYSERFVIVFFFTNLKKN